MCGLGGGESRRGHRERDCRDGEVQPSECRVKRGSTIPFVAATNGSELAFTINEDKLTRKSEVHVTATTRFDSSRTSSGTRVRARFSRRSSARGSTCARGGT